MKKLIIILSMLTGMAYAQCDTVTNLTISNLTYSSGRATFTPPAQAVSTYSWAIYTYPADVFTGVQGTGPSTVVNFTGLSASTSYKFKIATICVSAGTSVAATKIFTTAANTIVYTPEGPREFPYAAIDTLLSFKGGDTTLKRGPTAYGAIQYKTSNKTFYYWNTIKWSPLATDSAGIIAQLNDKVDSVTLSGNIVYYWKLGVAYGFTLPSNTGWYDIYRNGAADTTGTIDAAPIIQAAINSGWKSIFIPRGHYKISTTIQMKDSVTIMGVGNSSIVSLVTNIPGFKISLASGGNLSIIKDLAIIGNKSGGATTAQDGVLLDSAYGFTAQNVYAHNLGGAGFHFKHNGFLTGYPFTAVRGNRINSPFVDSSYAGVLFDLTAEYNEINGGNLVNNTYGYRNDASGNDMLTGVNISGNVHGFYMTGGGNHGHGTATGCVINHNTEPIYMNAVTWGYYFSNCLIYGDSDSARVLNCDRIQFTGGYFTPQKCVWNTNTNSSFNGVGDLLGLATNYTVTGTAPTIIKLTDYISMMNAKVGLGIATPLTELHVRENAASLFGATIENLNSSGQGLKVITNGTGSTEDILRLYSGGSGTTPRFAVRNNGDVLFGGAAGNAGYLLSSNGSGGGSPSWIDPTSILSVTPSNTVTLTNKRWTARVGSTTSSATPTINTDNVDIYKLTAQAADITSMTTNLSGTPVDGDILEIQITGTASRAITWGSSFVSTTVSLPAATSSTATLTVIVQYYTTSSYGNNKWACVNYY